MTTRIVWGYGAPVPPRSQWKALVLGLAACTGLGFALGWRWGK